MEAQATELLGAVRLNFIDDVALGKAMSRPVLAAIYKRFVPPSRLEARARFQANRGGGGRANAILAAARKTNLEAAEGTVPRDDDSQFSPWASRSEPKRWVN